MTRVLLGRTLRESCIQVFGCPRANAPASSTRTVVHTRHKDATSTITGMVLGLTFSGIPGPGKSTGSSDLISPPTVNPTARIGSRQAPSRFHSVIGVHYFDPHFRGECLPTAVDGSLAGGAVCRGGSLAREQRPFPALSRKCVEPRHYVGRRPTLRTILETTISEASGVSRGMASKNTINLDNLASLGADRLAAILVQLADDNADVKRHLRLELAAQMGGETIAAEIGRRGPSSTRRNSESS